MLLQYKTVYQGGEGEITEKKSRFIATVRPVKTEEEANKEAKVSPALGFAFDSTPVSTEIATIGNVTSQYLPGILCGFLDPETEIPKFLDALEDAGMEKLVEEKQTQYDTWRAENK